MATGDIIAVAVRADGWTLDATIEGYVPGASYDYGDGGFVCTVTSPGYTGTTLGTKTRTIYGTKTVRKPYPDHATLDETVSGSDIVVRVALSEQIYNDDTLDRVQIAAAWATNAGGASETSAAYDTTTTFTNNSTQDYPVAFGPWDIVAGVANKERVKSDFVMAFNAFHGHGIAAVKLTATGVTSGHSQTATVTTQTATQRSATSLYMSAYQTTIPLAGFTQGETITLRAQCYPNVGDADSIQDTTGRTTAANECLGWNEHTLICDKTDALDVIRYVHSSSGNDTTGDGSSGNPWATISKATTTATVNVVKLQDAGPHNFGSTATRKTIEEWVVVEPDTGITPTVKTTTTRTYRVQRLCLRNLTIQPTDTGSYIDGETLNFLWFDGCTFDKNGVGTLTVGPNYRSLTTYYTNCTGDFEGWKAFSDFSTGHMAAQVDGVASTGIAPGAFFKLVACSNISLGSEHSASNPAPRENGSIICNNILLNNTSTSGNSLSRGTIAALSNVAIAGNVSEKTGITSANWHLFGDNCAFAGTNFVVAHNTAIGDAAGGCRVNQWYNDAGSSAIDHSLIFERANHFQQANIKSDTFGTPNANRVGNWDQLYGVNFAQNNFDSDSGAGAFLQEATGVGHSTGTPSFEDAASDDYTPAAADTVLRGTASGLFHLRYDLYGNERFAESYDRGAINDTAILATVTTDTPADVSTDSATLGGNVTSDGGATVTERGVCYNTTGTPTTSDTKNANGSGTGTFSETSSGLTAGTSYYVRAYAINSVGTAYGSEQTFTTDEEDIVIGGGVSVVPSTAIGRLGIGL